jgi:hypothetical protein
VGTAQRPEIGLLTVLMKHNPDWAEGMAASLQKISPQ